MKTPLVWSEFKTQVTNKGKLRWIDRETFYLLLYEDFESSVLKDEGSEQTDFETNFKTQSNKSVENLDIDGATIIRTKAAKVGWTYQLYPVEFTTSKLNSLYSKKNDNTDRSGITYKIYDVDNVEITASENEVNVVKTIIDFEPPFDYEIIGGYVQQNTKPTTDCRVWVVGVPDVSEAYGGSKEMVGGVNLKFIDPTDKITADGRASKYMTYNATYHTNKLRLIVRHEAGLQHDLMIVFEIFKV